MSHTTLAFMARPVGRPRYDAKQKLTAAMRELLAERGYTATSPKMVLDRAKLGQGSLYYHFSGKEELATATITTLMDRSLTILTEDLDSDDDPDSGTPTEGSPRGVLEVSRIETALTGLLSRREGSALVRLLADPAATHPGPLADAIAVRKLNGPPTALRVVDADGDGRSDILVFHEYGTPVLLLGRVTGAFGVRGDVKLESWTEPRTQIFRYQPWILRSANGAGRELRGARGRDAGKGVVATLPGIDDRDAAEALRGTEVWVPREALPPPAPGEYYWVDLEGLRVVTTEGVVLGEVSHLLSTGASAMSRRSA